MMPDVRVESVRMIHSEGAHNAFTDLCRYHDRIWLAFRSCPDGHGIFPSSRIVVMSSADSRDWRCEHTFSVDGRDVRDPHLLAFRGALFVYTGTWLCEDAHDMNHHLGWCAWTEDGRTWKGPRFLDGTYGHYVWRAAAWGGRAYLCARRKHAFIPTVRETGDGAKICESAMMESDDGFVWRPIGFFQTEWGDETAFAFEPDGHVVAIARGGGKTPAVVCRSRPPFREWTRTLLPRNIGGPMLAHWGDRWLVGGRKTDAVGQSVLALWWLEGDEIREIATLPSGGDCSYPGFVETAPGHGLISWYSSHEGSGTGDPPSNIYLADLVRE